MKFRLRLPSLRTFSFRHSFLIILFAFPFPFISCGKKEAASRKEMEAELQELKSRSAEESLRIKELEFALQEEKNAQAVQDVIAQDQQKSEAEFETYREKNRQDTEKITPRPQPPAPDNDSNQGFSFTAVRSIPPPAPVPVAMPSSGLAPVSSGFAAPITSDSSMPSPAMTFSERKLYDLRQQLRTELNEIVDKIIERRRIRYGDVDSDGNRTYIQMSSYDPKTGQNKRGGGKAPKTDVDLENGVNQQYPENSSCFSAPSLSATLSHARVLRDEINDLKGQMAR